MDRLSPKADLMSSIIIVIGLVTSVFVSPLVVFFVIPYAQSGGYLYNLWFPMGLTSLAAAALIGWTGFRCSRARLIGRELMYLAAWMAVGGLWFLLRYRYFVIFFLVGLAIIVGGLKTLYRHLSTGSNDPDGIVWREGSQ